MKDKFGGRREKEELMMRRKDIRDHKVDNLSDPSFSFLSFIPHLNLVSAEQFSEFDRQRGSENRVVKRKDPKALKERQKMKRETNRDGKNVRNGDKSRRRNETTERRLNDLIDKA